MQMIEISSTECFMTGKRIRVEVKNKFFKRKVNIFLKRKSMLKSLTHIKMHMHTHAHTIY